MRWSLVLSAAAAGFVATACGSTVGADSAAPAATSNAFYGAIQRGDAGAACGLLAPETLASLERSQQQPCAQALGAMGLSAGRIRTVDVYGGEALV